jgi:hypothetical protein
MTGPMESSEPVPERFHGAVEAFLDGEIVASSVLRAALADQAARDHFVDLLVIRGALKSLESTGTSAPHQSHGSPRRAKWLGAVAAAALVSLTAGFLAGQRVMAATTARNAPSAVEAVVVVESAAAPAPTRSITFKPGVNWTDSSGGR